MSIFSTMILKWINNIPIFTLVKVAAGMSMVTVTMAFMTRNKISDNVKQTEYYKEAIANLRRHKGAISVLGEPIKDMTIQVGDLSKNFTKENQAQYEVPVYGSKQRGKLYFWAEKEDTENKWVVSRIELEINNEPYRRLLIRNNKLEQSAF